ncbi:MAG: hypothetical protein IPM82_00130 [Saprospiraceae bacterium]|nr:hypothetical protein [Saprospiraceae bacterium]
MKKQTIACLIFLSTLPILSFGQQTAESSQRTATPLQLFEIQRGEVEFFKTLVYRFEIAWEETDVQSMTDLRDGLLKLMEAEINQLADKTNISAIANDRLAEQKACLKKAKATPLAANDSAFGKQAEQTKALFHDFIKLMEADLTEQVEALRSFEKQ